MQRILAISILTWKAAFRFRLFWVLAGLLLGSVVVLPLLLRDDGTARGFIQIMLTYTLSVITTLLGFSTLWLACGTLARDIEDCQMQLVAVKPIARWQIWLGKLLGILMLNAVLLALAGGTVYMLLLWRANHLPITEQQILRNEIFVARGSWKEEPPDLEEAVHREFTNRIRQVQVPAAEHDLLRNQIREFFKAGAQLVPPGYDRPWRVDLGWRGKLLRDQPLYLRFKFYAARTNLSGLYLGDWRAGAPGGKPLWSTRKSLAADSFYELELPPNILDENGKVMIVFRNLDTAALLFPLEDGFEVLYREGGFGLNYLRGLLIIYFWLGLLAALGLAASSLLSFPVAVFVSVSMLLLVICSGTMATTVSEGTVLGVNHETGARTNTILDQSLIFFFKALLLPINLVQSFSPVDSLSTGRSISWGTILKAAGQIVFIMGGLLSLFGMAIFSRRELATAQSSQ